MIARYEVGKDVVSGLAGMGATYLGTEAGTAMFGAEAGKYIGIFSGIAAGFGANSAIGRLDKTLNFSGLQNLTPPEVNSMNSQHAVGTSRQAQSVLDGIDPKYFNPDSRFGGGFYVGIDADTIVVELAEHGGTARYSIAYDMDLTGQKVLDLTNPDIARVWDYVPGATSTNACQDIGLTARAQGYSVIKFSSYRGAGINYVLFDNFGDILSPRIVVPIE